MTEVVIWDGWIGGIAIGLYAILQVLLTGKLLGVSTGYGNLCSLASRLPFFNQGRYSHPNSWRLWFIIGIPLGGLLASLTSPGSLKWSFSLGNMYNSIMDQEYHIDHILLDSTQTMIA